MMSCPARRAPPHNHLVQMPLKHTRVVFPGTCNSERCRHSARLAATTCTTWHPTPPAATPTCAPAAGPRPAPTAAAAGPAAAAAEQRLPPLPSASWRSYAYRTGRMKMPKRAPARARTPAAVRTLCNQFCCLHAAHLSPARAHIPVAAREVLATFAISSFSCPLIASAMLCCSCEACVVPYTRVHRLCYPRAGQQAHAK